VLGVVWRWWFAVLGGEAYGRGFGVSMVWGPRRRDAEIVRVVFVIGAGKIV
jgi:hypothetical protein